MSNSQSRKQLLKKLSINLGVATPLVVAAFGMSQVATAQSVNCPPGSTYSQGVCLVTQSSQAEAESTYKSTGEAEAGSAYKASGEAEAGSAYKASGEAEAGSAYKANGEAEAGSAYKANGEAEAGSAYKANGESEATGEAESTGATYQPTNYQVGGEAEAEATGEAEAGSAYKANGEAEAGSAYKASGEAEATGEAEASSGTISSGNWTKKSFKSKGTWTLSAENGVTTISLDDDFSTRKAPDLKIFLSPLSAKDVKNKTALPGSLLIAPLTSNKGQQSYVVPAGTDLSKYKSVIIHCEAYTKLWSAADLF